MNDLPEALSLAQAVLDAEDETARLSRAAVVADEAYTKAVRRQNGRMTAAVEAKRNASILADRALEEAEAALAKAREALDRHNRRVRREAASALRQAERDRQPCLL